MNAQTSLCHEVVIAGGQIYAGGYLCTCDVFYPEAVDRSLIMARMDFVLTVRNGTALFVDLLEQNSRVDFTISVYCYPQNIRSDRHLSQCSRPTDGLSLTRRYVWRNSFAYHDVFALFSRCDC